MAGRGNSALVLLLLAGLMTSAWARSFQLPESWQPVSIRNPLVREAESLRAWLLQPEDGSPFPAVVLLHGCAGLMARHQAWAEELVEWGYAALIVDSFENRGGRPICRAWDGVWAKYNRLRPADAAAALAYLAAEPTIDAGRVALMGWSYGATITIKTLREPVSARAKPPADGTLPYRPLHYKAGIAFYPSCWQYLRYLKGPGSYSASAPLLILQGEADNWTLPLHCRRLQNQSRNSRFPVSLRLYPDAYHGFDDRSLLIQRLWGVRLESEMQPWGNVIIGYSKSAHQAARKDVRAILERYLSPQSSETPSDGGSP